MEILEIPQGVRLTGVQHFHPEHTFLSGQCFRWNQNADGSFTGVAMGRVLTVSAHGDTVDFHGTDTEEFYRVWMPYFDFFRDYGSMKAALCRERIMDEAAAFGWGIRILNQESWESLVSFIISQTNNIPRIKKIIGTLCAHLGKAVPGCGQSQYTFPSPEAFRGLTEGDLAFLRAGYRTKYILDAAGKVLSGAVDLAALRTLHLGEAREMLMQINGVGRKVADCVLLYGAGRMDCFPADVWIQRAMKGFYPEQMSRCKDDAAAAGRTLFGDYCGLAQQYLFYYARERRMFKQMA